MEAVKHTYPPTHSPTHPSIELSIRPPSQRLLASSDSSKARKRVSREFDTNEQQYLLSGRDLVTFRKCNNLISSLGRNDGEYFLDFRERIANQHFFDEENGPILQGGFKIVYARLLLNYKPFRTISQGLDIKKDSFFPKFGFKNWIWIQMKRRLVARLGDVRQFILILKFRTNCIDNWHSLFFSRQVFSAVRAENIARKCPQWVFCSWQVKRKRKTSASFSRHTNSQTIDSFTKPWLSTGKKRDKERTIHSGEVLRISFYLHTLCKNILQPYYWRFLDKRVQVKEKERGRERERPGHLFTHVSNDNWRGSPSDVC